MVIDFSSFNNFPQEFDKLFQDFFVPGRYSRRRVSYPPINIGEDDNNIYIRAEIPGVAIEDIDLTLTDKSIVITGERKNKEGRFFRNERPYGSFQRIISLNVPVERDSVKADLTNGILTVTLPKTVSSKPKKISIDVG
ncbi:Hsp20/alpha crystallin family protein [Maridesulfovibrio bastinii]|jgi:HSP20 family protein|uniref:Hsp20/alpha crystallin family protein n=1 Tax=Maridesulfovibrio bastinii TaxID=47157 RepID=UPI000402F633|nr:Hsp20/alpha crystallin family protein [Maridesulfovibrio bastinii]